MKQGFRLLCSEVARKEFPDLQVEERSAVSIARRLQDPLAELVKLIPKQSGLVNISMTYRKNVLPSNWILL